MSDSSVLTRLFARMRALLPKDWQGDAGNRFRRTMRDISDFATENNVQPKALAHEAVTLGRMKIEGLAAKEFASALRDFNEAEEKAISARLQTRSLDSKVRKEEAEARLAELKVLEAEIDLLSKLKAAGVVLRYDGSGNLTALPAENCDLDGLKLRKQMPDDKG